MTRTPKPITAESLRADRERRQRERDKLADDYDAAADALLTFDEPQFRGSVELLRASAKAWRGGPTR